MGLLGLHYCQITNPTSNAWLIVQCVIESFISLEQFCLNMAIDQRSKNHIPLIICKIKMPQKNIIYKSAHEILVLIALSSNTGSAG